MTLTIQSISHTYDEQLVLQDISLNVPKGHIGCLLGPSGCGKSTLLRLIAGLTSTQSGHVFLDNKEMTYLYPEKRRIGLVFQHPTLFPNQTALQNVMFAIHKHPPAQQRTIAKQWLNHLAIEHLADKLPHMLSGGQQQKVALARCLANSPSAILLDEPFANIDMVYRRKLRKEMIEALKATNIPVLMVTHDPEEAMTIADTIFVLQNNVITQQGNPYELYESPNSLFIAKLFGHINLWRAKVSKQSLDFPLGQIASTFPDGTDLVLGIRPEHIIIAMNSEPGYHRMRVHQVNYLGPLTRVSLQYDDTSHPPLLVRWPSLDQPNPGDIVYASYSKKHVILLANQRLDQEAL